MLSYAAHIPSNPLLLERIARHAFSDFKKMSLAVDEIAKDLHKHRIETILLITSTGIGFDNAHILNVSPEFEISFQDFGDFSTRESTKGDTLIAPLLSHYLCPSHSLLCVTNPNMDSSSSVAAMHLKARQKKYKLLPLTHSLEPMPDLFLFGKKLRDVLEEAPRRVAVVSVGDLCRSKQKDEARAQAIDKSIIDQLEHKNSVIFLKEAATAANEWFCRGARPLAMTLGLLDDLQYDFQAARYEQKFGQGMLAAVFAF